MNLFPNSNSSNPYANILQDPIKLASQINQFNSYNVDSRQNIIDEVRTKLTSLTQDEFESLRNTQEFSRAFTIYQTGLQEYVMNKFAYEYTNTDKGRAEISQVNTIIDNSIEVVREAAKREKEKLSKLSRLLEENPDLINQLEKSQNGGKANK